MRAAPILLGILVLASLPPVPATGGCADVLPVNDCRENAIELTTRAIHHLRASTRDAGEEPGEASPCGTTGTVWWKFTAFRASSGALSVHDSDFSAAVAVYEAQPDGGLQLLDCQSGWSAWNWATFECVAGREYYVQAGGDEGGWGTLDLFGDLCQLGPERPRAPALDVSATAARGELSLSWTAPDDGGSPITGYRMYGATGTCSGMPLLATLPASQTSWTQGGLPEGASTCYEVAAVNAVGEGARSDPGAGTPLGVPMRPALVGASPLAGGIRVAWWAPDDGGSPFTGFRVYRADEASGPFALAGEAPADATSFTDPQGERVTRHYRVAAVNALGEGAPSAVVSATTPGKPTAPYGVSAVWSIPTGIRVAWSAPSDEGGLPLAAYHVYRGEKGEPLSLYAVVPGDTRTYVDRAPGLLVPYDYAVLAVNALGESPLSGKACGQAPPTPRAAGGC